MMVKELIKSLLDCPMDAEVKISDKSNNLDDILYLHKNKVQDHIEIMTYRIK